MLKAQLDLEEICPHLKTLWIPHLLKVLLLEQLSEEVTNCNYKFH